MRAKESEVRLLSGCCPSVSKAKQCGLACCAVDSKAVLTGYPTLVVKTNVNTKPQVPEI